MNDPTQSRYRYITFKNSSTYRRYVQEKNDRQLSAARLIYKNSHLPAHGSYGALLFDSRWKQKRAEILNRDSHCCVICKSKDELQIHHRQYHFVVRENQFKAPWDYDNHLLISLCGSCHSRGHNKYKVPTLIV